MEEKQLQSNRKPSSRAVKAVKNLSENIGNPGYTKGDALRDAGFSKSVAETPGRVFNSPYLKRALDERGLTERPAVEVVQNTLKARKMERMVFPPYSKETQGDQLTDKDIIILLEGANCVVINIVHRKQARHVYFWANDYKSQLAAANLLFDLMGSKAPRKREAKPLGKKFSLKEMRKWRVDNNLGSI